MIPLIIAMLVCVGLALAVVALVAVPARREGRELLTPQGEEIVAMVKEKAEATVEKTGDALTTAKDRVADSVGSGGSAAPEGSVGSVHAVGPAGPVGGSSVEARADEARHHRAS